MLPRKSLVPLKKEFGRIRSSGKMYDSLSFGLVVDFGAKDGPQAAFIVSKKISKSSVVRHNIKRKLSDSVSPLLVRINKNTELVFLAKQGAVSASKEALSLEIDILLKRARLL